MAPELIVTIFILVALLGLMSLLSWIFARLYARPKRRVSLKTPGTYDLTHEPISFFSSEAKSQGWYIDPGNGYPARGVIIMAHGWSRSKEQMLPVAKFLSQAGYASLLFDMRGHGTSDSRGPITILKFAEDISAAIDHLEDSGLLNGADVGVIGHSMGAAGAILAASLDGRIKALVSSSAFADPVRLTLGFMQKARLPSWPFFRLVRWHIERWLGTTMEDVAPYERIERLSIPILLIHGGSDRFIPLTNLRLLYQRAPKKWTQRLVLSGRKHSDVLLDPTYVDGVLKFLDDNFGANATNRPDRMTSAVGQTTLAR